MVNIGECLPQLDDTDHMQYTVYIEGGVLDQILN